MCKDPLNNVRTEITRLDEELATLLEKRLKLAQEVAKIKIENRLEIFDEAREIAVTKKYQALVPKYKAEAAEFSKTLMSISKDVQSRIIEDTAKEKTPPLKVLVVGLGLIGGSFCYALQKYTRCEVYGYDTNDKVVEKALQAGVIKSKADEFSRYDVIIICLYKNDTISFLQKYSAQFSKEAIVLDTAGVKTEILNAAAALQPLHYHFFGGHPMAGSEKTGFEAASATLFCGAYFLLVPFSSSPQAKERVIKLLHSLQFCEIIETTATHHDKVIAFTSQLPHIVSSCFVKSKQQKNNKGFSAGSYKDLSRVAKQNSRLWSELFLGNKENISLEIESIVEELNKYLQSIKNEDKKLLVQLIEDGNGSN